jgi:hypothetical protein
MEFTGGESNFAAAGILGVSNGNFNIFMGVVIYELKVHRF